MATPKQVDYATALAEKAGYGRFLSARLAAELPRDLSFSGREAAKYQTVANWVAAMPTQKASQLIDWLKNRSK
jgi:hypothetical protein